MGVRMPYLFYLVLGESIFSEIACIICVIVNIRILYIIFAYLKKKKVELSPILILHVMSWLFLSISWLIQNTYVIIFWQSDRIQYNPKVLWYTGMACLSLVPFPAIALLFSTLERCVVFIFHNNNTVKRIQNILFASTCCISLCLWCTMIHSFLISTPFFSDTTVSECLSPNCLSIDNAVDQRLNAVTVATCLVSLVAAGVLLYFIQTLNFKSPTHKAATMLTIRIVFIQIFLDIITHVCAFLTPAIFNEIPSNILGSYIRVISSLNGCICSIVFVKTIERMKKLVHVRLVGQSSTPKTKTVPAATTVINF